MFKSTFDSVGHSLEDDTGRAQGPRGPVVVNGGSLQFPELGEEFADVGIGDAGVQVADVEFSGSGGLANDATSAGSLVLKKSLTMMTTDGAWMKATSLQTF